MTQPTDASNKTLTDALALQAHTLSSYRDALRAAVTLQYQNSIKRNRMGDGKHNGNDYMNWWIYAFADEFYECQQINGRMRMCLSLPNGVWQISRSLADSIVFAPLCENSESKFFIIFYVFLDYVFLFFHFFFIVCGICRMWWCCVRRYNAKVIILFYTFIYNQFKLLGAWALETVVT